MPLPIYPASRRLDAKLAWSDSGGEAGAGFEPGAKEPSRSLRTRVAPIWGNLTLRFQISFPAYPGGPFIVINDQAARPA